MIRRRRVWTAWLLVALTASLAAVAACSLNPQPIPPGDEADASMGGADAANSKGGGDGETPDGAEPVGMGDADTDGSTLANDADGGDAATDGATDASLDAPDGAD